MLYVEHGGGRGLWGRFVEVERAVSDCVERLMRVRPQAECCGGEGLAREACLGFP